MYGRSSINFNHQITFLWNSSSNYHKYGLVNSDCDNTT